MSSTPESTTDLVDAYLAGSDSARRVIAGMDRNQLRARPIAGTWSTLEVVCHLADSEAVFADRMKRVLAEDRPAMPFADPNLYVAALAYGERDAAHEAEVIAAIRRQMSRILRAEPLEAWRRVGIHAKEGERTLEDLVRKAIGHMEHHLEFVREKQREMDRNEA